MRLSVISLSYINTPIEILEKCSCNKDDITAYLSTTIGTLFFDEMIILSTCNRTEWIFISPDSDKAVDLMFEQIKDKSHISVSILKKYAKVFD